MIKVLGAKKVFEMKEGGGVMGESRGVQVRGWNVEGDR
jgi:hypothetical protein